MSLKFQLEQTYREDPDKIKLLVYVSVSESKKSIETRLLDNQASIVLEIDKKKGEYWIIESENSIYYLFPKENFRVNQFNYQTLEAIFECDGYEAGQTNFLNIISCARVHPINDDKTEWIVAVFGKISFTSEQVNSPISDLISEIPQVDVPATILDTELVTQSQQESSLSLEMLQEENNRLKEKVEKYEKIISNLHSLISGCFEEIGK